VLVSVEVLADVSAPLDVLVSVEVLADVSAPLDVLVSVEALAEVSAPLEVPVSTEALVEPPLVSNEALVEPPLVSTEALIEPLLVSTEAVVEPVGKELVSSAWAMPGRTPSSSTAAPRIASHATTQRRRRSGPLRRKNPLWPNDRSRSRNQRPPSTGQASCLAFCRLYPLPAGPKTRLPDPGTMPRPFTLPLRRTPRPTPTTPPSSVPRLVDRPSPPPQTPVPDRH